MKTKLTVKQETKINRYYMIVKIFLMVTPFIAYAYISLLASMSGSTFASMLSEQPSLAITLVISMLNPYMAYLIHLSKQKLNQGDHKFAVINFILLIIATALTQNLLYLLIIGYLFYVTVKTYQIDIFKTLKSNRLQSLLFQGGGSLIVIALSSVCLFATIRLM